MVSRATQYKSIILNEPFPPGLSWGETLVALYMLQAWEKGGTDPQGKLYAKNWFYNRVFDQLSGLSNPGRETAFKHLATPACLRCALPVNLARTTLDHVIPRHQGGSEDVSNALVLCRPCNSSKGIKDLLHWWMDSARHASELDPRALIIYSRAHWRRLTAETCAALAPDGPYRFLQQRCQVSIPDANYLAAFFGATFAAIGYTLRWNLQEPSQSLPSFLMRSTARQRPAG